MSGGVVCYIERSPGGTGIRRLRLVAAGLARSWTAPEPRSVSSVDSGMAGASSPAVGAARAGATWVAETLAAVGLKRLAAVCVDSEGSICAWLSAPSPEQSVIQATIAQSAADGDGSGAGVGAARLLTTSDGDAALSGQTSLQALATLELDEEEPTKRTALSFRKKAPAAAPRKQRYAVVAIQDAIVRVLLDELDERGIEIERVVSLWHAMAEGWDRSHSPSASDRLIASDSSSGAVILVEPHGRLVWAWTRAGELVAGGSMRLASHARPTEQADAPKSEALAAPATSSETTRRSTFDAPESDESPVNLDFAPADAGRLAVDWLAWSAQLGHCPQRVVCLSVPSLTGKGLGPEALFSHLAQAWPGATIDGAVHDDPIGATIGRLAGLGPEVGPGTQAVADELPYHLRPRQALTALTSRPGVADRRLHQWIGVSLCAAAAFIGVLGWQIRSSVNALETQTREAVAERKQALKDAETLIPNLSQNNKPLDALQAAVNRVLDQNKAMKPARPILPETVRILSALKSVNGEGTPAANRTTLTELEMSTFAGKAALQVPDAATGPTILEKVLETDGVLLWTGTTTTNFANPNSAARTYILTAPWPDTNVVTPGKKPSGAPTPANPTAPPAAPPTPAPSPTPADAKPETPNNKS